MDYGGTPDENGYSRKPYFVAWLISFFILAMPIPSAQYTKRTIMSSSPVRMTQTATRLAAAEITPSFAAFLSTAASRLVLRLRTGWRGQKLLPAVVAAKVERLSITLAT